MIHGSILYCDLRIYLHVYIYLKEVSWKKWVLIWCDILWSISLLSALLIMNNNVDFISCSWRYPELICINICSVSSSSLMAFHTCCHTWFSPGLVRLMWSHLFRIKLSYLHGYPVANLRFETEKSDCSFCSKWILPLPFKSSCKLYLYPIYLHFMEETEHSGWKVKDVKVQKSLGKDRWDIGSEEQAWPEFPAPRPLCSTRPI